jgi:hypothetical protein
MQITGTNVFASRNSKHLISISLLRQMLGARAPPFAAHAANPALERIIARRGHQATGGNPERAAGDRKRDIPDQATLAVVNKADGRQQFHGEPFGAIVRLVDSHLLAHDRPHATDGSNAVGGTAMVGALGKAISGGLATGFGGELSASRRQRKILSAGRGTGLAVGFAGGA